MRQTLLNGTFLLAAIAALACEQTAPLPTIPSTEPQPYGGVAPEEILPTSTPASTPTPSTPPQPTEPSRSTENVAATAPAPGAPSSPSTPPPPTSTPAGTSTPTPPSPSPTVTPTPSPPPAPAAGPAPTPLPTPTPPPPTPTDTPPPPTSTPVPVPTATSTSTPTPPPPIPTDTPVPLAQGIAIECIFFDGEVPGNESDEYVQIANQGSTSVDLAGWTLVNETRGNPTFVFPSHTLNPGRRIRVYTNEVHPEWGGLTFGRGTAAWSNTASQTAVLRDAQGREISRNTYDHTAPPGC